MTRWQVFGAVALRRLPEVIPARDPIQIKVQKIFDAYEASKSRYSEHEMKHLEETRIKDSDEISDLLSTETAQDREDRWSKEREGYQAADYDERLSKTQYLFIQSKFGTDIKEQWLLPQVEFNRKLGDNNLADTARRALKGSLDIHNGYRIISKIPSSVCSFNYPKKIQEESGYRGAKVFFVKANLDLPDESVLEALDASKNSKLKWMTRDEAVKAVDETYMRSLSSGLLHERTVDVNKVLARAANYANSIKQLSARVSH